LFDFLASYGGQNFEQYIIHHLLFFFNKKIACLKKKLNKIKEGSIMLAAWPFILFL
jgi:hypothetical protein